jgi:hypothetical protein
MSTSFYDQYLINNRNNVNVLKKDYTLNYTDYEKLKINEQYNKLYSNVYETNKDNNKNYENNKIYNLSLLELSKKSSKVYIEIVNDLSAFFSKENKNKSMNEFGNIIVKNDNLLFIGILFIIISFFLWIIDVSK